MDNKELLKIFMEVLNKYEDSESACINEFGNNTYEELETEK